MVSQLELSRHVYSRQMLKDAFNDRASTNVLKKIIVKVQPENGGNEALSIPRFICKSEGSYLIIEGLSDFGLELVDFLVARGARNIVIVSEAKSTRVYSDHKISLWKKYEVTVVVREELNLSYQQNVNDILKDISTFGIVDAIFDLQRIGNSSRMTSTSKYLFTKHLFKRSQQLFPDLRQFIVFSTCKDIKENVDDVLLREIGLTKICHEESKETFPGLLILLGPITGIADLTSECEANVPLLSISSIMEQLDNLMEMRTSIVSICCKLSQVDGERENEIIPIVETERSKFDKYVSLYRPSTMASSLQINVKIIIIVIQVLFLSCLYIPNLIRSNGLMRSNDAQRCIAFFTSCVCVKLIIYCKGGFKI